MKSFQNPAMVELPGWTGYNTLLESQKHLVKSIIAYCPVIEGSPTQMPVIAEIVRRCIEMADKLELEEILCCYDLAIYAKVQEL